MHLYCRLSGAETGEGRLGYVMSGLLLRPVVRKKDFDAGISGAACTMNWLSEGYVEALWAFKVRSRRLKLHEFLLMFTEGAGNEPKSRVPVRFGHIALNLSFSSPGLPNRARLSA